MLQTWLLHQDFKGPSVAKVVLQTLLLIVDRPGVAGAVLQTPM